MTGRIFSGSGCLFFSVFRLNKIHIDPSQITDKSNVQVLMEQSWNCSDVGVSRSHVWNKKLVSTGFCWVSAGFLLVSTGSCWLPVFTGLHDDVWSGAGAVWQSGDCGGERLDNSSPCWSTHGHIHVNIMNEWAESAWWWAMLSDAVCTSTHTNILLCVTWCFELSLLILFCVILNDLRHFNYLI